MPMIDHDEALERLRGGDRIIATQPSAMKASDKPCWRLAGGGEISSVTWSRLQEHIEPCGDGLFPDGPSQSYRAREA